MAKKWGSADYGQLKQLQQRLQKLQQTDLDKFCEKASKELAARLLSLVIPRTPVGQYPASSGRKGGTLRRGWTGGKQVGNVGVYAKTLAVSKNGEDYIIEVINPVKYASYVEYGHRTPDHKGWVPGQYFLTLSEHDLQSISPRVLENLLNKFLRGVFNV